MTKIVKVVRKYAFGVALEVFACWGMAWFISYWFGWIFSGMTR